MIKNQILICYRSHQNFISNRDTNEIKIFNQSLFKIKDLLQSDFFEHSKLDEHINNYDSLFQLQSQKILIAGLDENSGIEGVFRSAAHKLEDIFKDLNEKNSLAILLEIRRREKDYLLRRETKYIDSVQENIQRLLSSSKIKKLNNAKRELIQKSVLSYKTKFIEITDLYGSIEIDNISIANYLNTIIDDIDILFVQSDKSQKNLFDLSILIFVVLFFTIILFSFKITKSVITSINFLVDKIKDIDSSNIQTRIPYTKNDEIGQLSNSFNNMLNRLEDALNEIKFSKDYLEDRVKQRTNELEVEIKAKNEYEQDLKKALSNINKIKEELKVSLNKERDLNQLKSNFVSMISHEYRTPLTVILTSTYLLEKFFFNGDRENFIKKINQISSSVNTMKELMDNTIMLSDIESNNLKTDNYEFDIIDSIKSVIFQVEQKENTKIYFNSDLNQLILNNDPKKFGKAIYNLLTNSIKSSDTKANLNINIEVINGYLNILIIDKGISLANENQHMIFNPYYRATEIKGTPGIGLGLSISKELIESMGGYIKFESNKNNEGMFVIKFEINEEITELINQDF
jgi:signal transduction histidine kinase